MNISTPLKDKWVVVTRPSHQSEPFQEKLRSAGANVISFPLLAISPSSDQTLAKQQLEKINDYDLIIFVSANAVKQFLKLLPKHLPLASMSTLKITAVGKKTAEELTQQGINVSFFPKKIFNSEALLAMPEIKTIGTKNVNANKVAIIRGEGGRDLLKAQLQKQGAQVDYINVYKRSCPQTSLKILSEHYKNGQLDIILLTSGNSASNLFDLQATEADNTWLNKVTLMVGSERIKQHVLNATPHTGELIAAEDPSDETLFQQLSVWATD